MSDNVDDLEIRGFEFLKREHWGEARQCFEEMLCIPVPTKRQVKVLQNILLTFQRQGRIDEAITTGERTLELIEHSDFGQTLEGTFVHGQVLGFVKKMRRDQVPLGPKRHYERQRSPRLLRLLGLVVLGSLVYFVITKWLH